MKKNALLIACLAIGFLASAQGGAGLPPSIPFSGVGSRPIDLNQMTSRPLRMLNIPDLQGVPYMSAEFKPGYVQIRNGYAQQNVPIRFNIYRNVLEFKRNGMELELDSLEMAMYLDVPGDSSSIRVFKAGYPDVDNQNTSTIYEVLAIGEKAHLVKYVYQKLEDVKAMGDYDKKQLTTYSKLYLYVPGKEMMKAKADKKFLTNLFPRYAQQIEKLIREKDYNLKKDSEYAQLIGDLNELK
ncbi:MAG TPA: hypothetical protein VGB46_07740 [Flavisolibacter sp.]